MMKFLKTILNVNDFEIKNHALFILRGEMMRRSVLLCDSLNNERVLIENIVIPSFRATDDSLWIYSKGKTFEFSKENDFGKPNIFVNYFPKYKYNNILIGDFKEEDNRYLQSKNIDNGKTIWILPFTSTIFLINTQIYLVKFTEDLQKREIVAFDFHTGVPLWQYTLKGEYDYEDKFGTKYRGEIQRIIGQYEGILWVALENGYLLGLSVADGRLVHELSVPNNFTEHFPKEKPRFGANYTQFDEIEGKLFGMRLNYYWEINLQNPNNEYVLYDIRATCEEKQVVINYVEYETWQGQEIIFREWSFAQDPSYVGIFNRKTRQITWTSRELGEEGVFKGIHKIEYHQNRLYVLDRAGTLHIFERDSPV